MKAQAEEVRSPEDLTDLLPATVVLTEGMWSLLKRDALNENRSESYILREIVGRHFTLPPAARNPRRKAHRTKEES